MEVLAKARPHKDPTTGPIWILSTLGWALSWHQALPWALCGALGTTGCSWHQGMFGTGDTLDPLGMQDAQDTVGGSGCPVVATHAPCYTTL